jgi:hypothetical protein
MWTTQSDELRSIALSRREMYRAEDTALFLCPFVSNVTGDWWEVGTTRKNKKLPSSGNIFKDGLNIESLQL